MAGTRDVKAGGAYVELTVSDKLLPGLKKAAADLKRFGNSLKDAGKEFLKVGVGAAAGLGLAVHIFADFEQSMARLKALTNASGKEFEDLTEIARKMGRETVFTAKDAADAMNFFALAGFSVTDMMKALEPTLQLAAAGQLDIAESADIVAKVMAGMGIAAEDVGYAVDVMTKAMTTANTNLTQLGEAMKYVGPIAKSAGLKFEEIVAAIQLLSKAGIQAEMAGTTLRGMILSLASPTAETAKELDKLSVRVNDAKGNMRPLADIIEDIGKATKGLGTGEKLDVLGRIFNARQAAGAAVLLDRGANKLREYEDALRKAGGTAKRISDTLLNTLLGAFKLLTSALEDAGIAIGIALNPSLRTVLKYFTDGVIAIEKWIIKHKALVVAVGAVTAGIIALGATLFAAGVGVKLLGVAVGGLSTAAGVAVGSFKLIISLLGAMISPIGLVIAALGTLAIWFVTSTDQGVNSLIWLSGKFTDLEKIARDSFKSIAAALASGDIVLAAKILWATLALEWVEGTKELRRLWYDFMAGIVKVAVVAFYSVLEAWANVQAKLLTLWAESASAFKTIWAAAVSVVQDVFEDSFRDQQKMAVDNLRLMGKITKEEADKRKAFIDQQFDAQRGLRRKNEVVSAEAEQKHLADQLKAIEAEKRKTLAELEKAEGDLVAAADKNAEEDKKKLEERIADLKKQLEELRAKAEQKKEEMDMAGPPGGPITAPAFPGQDEMDNIAGAITQRGTFNIGAIQSLQGSGTSKIVDAVNGVEKAVRDVEQKIGTSPIVS